jgi:HAD superfamily hydrolase (TIGR01490 family)
MVTAQRKVALPLPFGLCHQTPKWTPMLRPVNTPDPRVAAFFDLDKTIIAKSSTLAFSKPFFRGGLINRRAVLKSSYAQFVFLLAGADDDQMDRMRVHITALCAGWEVDQVRAIVEETLHDIVDPLVYREATELIGEHKAQGHDVVVVSASGQELVTPIGELVGATHAIGTRAEIVTGRYTGEVEFYCAGKNKVAAVRRLADEQGYRLAECHAYSDSIADLPLLEAVGHPTAVNADRALRREAAQRGWPMLTFSEPTSLRSRIPTPSGTAVATAAVGLGAVAAAGFAWYGLRRRRRP